MKIFLEIMRVSSNLKISRERKGAFAEGRSMKSTLLRCVAMTGGDTFSKLNRCTMLARNEGDDTYQ